MFGKTYLKVKRHWRAWLKICILTIQEPLLLKKIQTHKKEPGIVISLTTFQPRIGAVNHTLKSIVAGDILPEGIYMYLDQETFSKITEKKSFTTKLIDMGFLHIRKVEDVRSYKKLIFALLEHPEKNIVISDDDVLYPTYWLSALVQSHKKWSDKKAIVCHRGHEVLFEANGELQQYNNWPKSVTKFTSPSSFLFPTGTGGVLYPSGSMPAITWDINLFKKYAPTNDDIWFYFSALSNNYTFVSTDYPFEPKQFPDVPDSQTHSLFTINVYQNANDSQLKNTMSFFKERGLTY